MLRQDGPDGAAAARIRADAERAAIVSRLAAVRMNIAKACARAGRDPASVRLLPVTKTVSAFRLRAAHAAGLSAFGENKVQEAVAKAAELADLDLRWSLIGHLQTNKARFVARFAAEFQALDSLRVTAALDRHLQAEGRGLDVMIQVNSSGEASKFGLPPDDVPAFTRELPAFSALRVVGLMTLALFSADPAQVRPCFARMRAVQARLRDQGKAGQSFDQLSMGMSGDYEIAIEEGATVLRIGQAIFGSRPTPDAAYWPGAAS